MTDPPDAPGSRAKAEWLFKAPADGDKPERAMQCSFWGAEFGTLQAHVSASGAASSA